LPTSDLPRRAPPNITRRGSPNPQVSRSPTTRARIPAAIFCTNEPIMTELTCQQCGELAAELAVGVLTNCERARVLAHLNGCSSCRDTTSALTTIAHQIIELLPEVQPAAGFEQRVITALAQLRYQRHLDQVGSSRRKINGYDLRTL